MQESGEHLTFGSLNAPTLGLQAEVVKSAHKHGLVLNAQVDGLAHQFYDKPHTKELIDTYKKRNAFVIPTFTAINSMMGVRIGEEFAQDPRAVKDLSESTLSCLCDQMSIALPSCNIQYAYDCIRALKSEGIDIVW